MAAIFLSLTSVVAHTVRRDTSDACLQRCYCSRQHKRTKLKHLNFVDETKKIREFLFIQTKINSPNVILVRIFIHFNQIQCNRYINMNLRSWILTVTRLQTVFCIDVAINTICVYAIGWWNWYVVCRTCVSVYCLVYSQSNNEEKVV